jgi:hypothetical protein
MLIIGILSGTDTVEKGGTDDQNREDVKRNFQVD